MRDVADSINPVAAALPTQSVATYLQVLDLATEHGLLDTNIHELTVDALLNHWNDNDPRWNQLPQAA